jgi:uncharacterized protein YceK
MKKILFAFMIILLLAGCSGITINKDVTADSAYTIGKMAGIYVAMTEPGYVAVALPYAEGLLKIAKAGEITDTQMMAAIDALSAKYGNNEKYVVIATLFVSEFATVKIETGKVNEKLVLLIDGFISGCKAIK